MAESLSFNEANVVQRGIRRFGASAPGSWLFKTTLRPVDKQVFRMSGGKRTFASMLSGLPVVMLTTTGARSGKPRTVPVLGIPTDGTVAVIASNFGQKKHPAWYHNLRAHPEGELSVDGQKRRYRAVEATGEQRRQIWEAALKYYPGFNTYETRASHRDIHVFVLELA